jgi:hypothetical protein
MDSSPSAYAKYVALAATVYFGWRFLAQRARRGGRPLPPGPAPLPFLGNIRDLPAKHEWLTYAEWTKQYGAGPLLVLAETLRLIQMRT